jgi:uncharacterized protein (TIGR03067 family)
LIEGPATSGGGVGKTGGVSGCAELVVDSTIKAASQLAAGTAAKGASSVKVAALTEGVIKAMLFTKLKAAFGVVLILGFVATRATILTCRTEAGQGHMKPAAEKLVEPGAKQEKNKEIVTAWGKGEGAPDATPPTSATELAKFEGTWVLVSSERNGQVTSEEKNPYRLTFTGDMWKVHRGDEVAVKGTLRLVDISTTPRKFDLVKSVRFAPGTSVDYGIYEWKGNTLRYCTRNGPLGSGIDTRDLRPRDFTTRDGDGRTVYLWKRAQPAAKAPTGSDERSAVELPWGDAVEDVQARLRPKKVNWQAKETPVFQLELRSQGKRSWKGVATQHYCELQVDGKWYKYGANFPGAPLTALKPGMHADHWLEVSLGSQWYKVANEKEKPAEEDKPGGKGGPIVLSPGKHSIRLAYRLINTRLGDGIPEIRVLTNAVEIEINFANNSH